MFSLYLQRLVEQIYTKKNKDVTETTGFKFFFFLSRISCPNKYYTHPNDNCRFIFEAKQENKRGNLCRNDILKHFIKIIVDGI